ncbi:hypothetical protein GCM10008960_36280 [Deinococcus sedimenti]|uniref:Uncharacterized protein n=2 Tax=Deinococcus sedimenti TaxID=1867090 RepID=A0ABQ2S8R7_9DEIO|nr:hypothetical protein GCM10008960_36280 [Deinococcus sedimenti]
MPRARMNPTSSRSRLKPKPPSEISIDFTDLSREDNYKWADHIELLCLFAKDGIITSADVELMIDHEEDIYISNSDEEGDFDSTERGDSRELAVSDWFRILRYRAAQFGDSYPFDLDDSNNIIMKKSVMEDNHKLYISMLASSNLRYFKYYSPRLTSSFERVSADVLKAYLPTNAEVHNFGAGSTNVRVSEKYNRGSLYDRILELAADLRWKPLIERRHYNRRNNGDDGLDLVAWIPINDENSGMVVLFGQCACTDNWTSKQHSSGTAKWGRRLDLTCDFVNTVFIPICFRDSAGLWHAPQEIEKSILFDRLRIIRILGSTYADFASLPAHTAVGEILRLREARAV